MQVTKKFSARGMEFVQLGTTDGENDIRCFGSIGGQYIVTYCPVAGILFVVDTECHPEDIPYWKQLSYGWPTIEEALEALFKRWEGEE